MKKLLSTLFVLFLCISQAHAQTTIWGSSDRSATTTEMRFPVSTSAVDTPGLLRIEPATPKGIYFNSAGRVYASSLNFNSAGTLFLSGAAQYCDENGANCFDPSEVGGALQNIVEDLSPQLGANLDLNTFVITGLEIGTDVQAFDAVLDDLAALAVIADNEFIVGTGAGTYANESGATVRTSLGLTISTDVQAFDTNLDDLAALAVVADNEIAVGTGAGTYAFESGATLLTSIGADPIGTDNSTDVTLSGALDYITIIGQDITRNAIDLTTDTTGDLAVTDGGTGSSTAGGARTNLGLVIGTDVQAFDTNLEDIAALAIVADNELMVGNGVGTYAFESGATLQTSLGLAIGTNVQAWDAVLDDLSALAVIADNEFIVGTGAGTYANESGVTVRASMGVAIGTDVQAFDAVLEDLAALAVIADNEIIVGTGAGTYANEGGATARTSLGLAIGTDIQAFDAVLEDLAALSVIADNEFIVGTGAGTYANESGATVRTSLGLVIGTDVQAFDANLEDIAALAVVADNELMVGTGAGTYAFESGATLRTSIGALANLVEDATPQLGGDLDGQNNIFENVGAIRYQSSRDQPACTTALEGTIFYNSASNNFNFCDDVGSVQIFSTGGAGLANIVEDTSPQLGAQLDVNAFGLGDGTLELLTFTEDGSAINHINIENQAIGSGPILSAVGDDTNVDLNLNGKATGNVIIRDGTDVTKAFSMELGGATTGTTTTLAVSQTGNVTVTLPDATDQLVARDTTDTLTTKSMAAGSNTFTGFVWDTNIFADGTDGQIPTFDANGEPAFVATGTAAQVLTSNGSGTAPTFQAAAGGGAWTLLATASASNSASIDFTSASLSFDSTFETYIILLESLIPVNDGPNLYLRTSNDGGATFDATTSYDSALLTMRASTLTLAQQIAEGAAQIILSQSLGNGVGEGISGEIILHNPSDASQTTLLTASLSGFIATSAGEYVRITSGGMRNTAEIVNGISIFAETGNISGEVKIYGVEK